MLTIARRRFLGLLAFALLPQLLVFAGWLITGAIAIALAIALVVLISANWPESLYFCLGITAILPDCAR